MIHYRYLKTFLSLTLILLMTGCDFFRPSDKEKENNLAQKAMKRAPLSLRSTLGLRESFNNYYLGNQCEPDGTVQNRFNQPFRDTSWIVIWEELNSIINVNGMSENEGVIFHYTIRNIGGTNYFGYTLSKGTLNETDSTLKTSKFDNGMFVELVFQNQDPRGFRNIDSIASLVDIHTYDSIRVYDDYACPDTFYTATSSKHIDTNIVRQCFYYGYHLKAFASHNASDCTPCNSPPTHLFVASGAAHVTQKKQIPPRVSFSYFAQTPVLQWGCEDVRCQIDNTFIQGRMFQNKAMDVGHLCPPNCQSIDILRSN